MGFPKTIYLFPPAGAGATFYRGWKEALGANVRTVVWELPGRGRRINEPPANALTPLAEQFAAQEMEKPPAGDIALFGLSLGALFAYEVAHALARIGRRVDHLFVASFCAPPRYPELGKAKLSTLSDADLVQYLRDMGGTPQELLDSQEWMDFLLPVLRGDLKLIDEHPFANRPRLEAPITALSGANDRDYPEESHRPWGDLTCGAFRFESFPGGHFFVADAAVAVQTIVRETLERA